MMPSAAPPAAPRLRPLIEANDLLPDAAKLSWLLESHGYLFFRGLLDADRVSKVRRDIIRVLSRYGVVTRGEAEPIWTGRSYPSEPARLAAYRRVLALQSFRHLATAPELLHAIERILSGPAYVWVTKVCRIPFPNDDFQTTPIHQDRFPVRGSPSFYTAWVPLIDIEASVGGLAVASGSHLLGFRESDYRYSDSVYLPGIPEGRYELDWHWSEYRVGDVLTFSNFTMHRALPNTSNKMRLSADYRYQRQGTPVDWSARRRQDWIDRYKLTIYRLVARVRPGASCTLQEEVFRKIKLEGGRVDAGRVKRVLAALRETG